MMTREVFSLVKASVENDEITAAQRIAGHQYLSQRTLVPPRQTHRRGSVLLMWCVIQAGSLGLLG
jgi:hypothetical protein